MLLCTLKSTSVFFLAFALLILVANAFSNTISMSMSSPSTKRVLVTGGNKGIGYAICKKLLQDHTDVHVILGSRDQKRGEDAVASLKSSVQGSSDRVELVVMDTCDEESVKKAVELSGVNTDTKQLYGIVNNAGIGFGNDFKDTINTNYFGPRRVCDVFSPFLMRPHGRIVNIASASGPMFVAGCQDSGLAEKLTSPLSFKEGSSGDGIDKLDELAGSYSSMTDYGGDAYGVSKALLNAYTVLYAAANPDLIVNSCTPGYIATDLTKGMGATNPPEKGAVSPIHILMNEEMKTLPTGRYYGSDAIRSPLHYYRGPGDPPYEGP